ncbi:30S ribosome-binding factor RbfA [Clostridium cellulovorans]|uniref:Ribosome-binding factor A n=1 Tax=Clostridium cellulovorans (strain ATCC 35296 / DSM 3052 / OCM 3 / 743B) TaxID=573061 RepID=D9SKN7_CLOC7|nr:30S ribosome-binding factor RbfA [Clostridium cellulovorans]ADL51533.1 ribosome-binding factor A [Clostridium cellulovorans 743B]
MARYRSEKINEEMKKQISDVIRNRVRDPRLAPMISVTSVDVTKDLKYAKVYVSIFGSDTEKDESLKILKNSSGFIRREVASKINLRSTPELLFNLDTSIEYGMHIDRLIHSIKENEDNGDESDTEEN